MKRLTPKDRVLIECSLQQESVFAYPTEAVYGLGCDPWSERAVIQLLSLKKRPVTKGLILLASDLSALSPLTDRLSPTQLAQLKTTWPGPITWTLPHFGLIPSWIHGGKSTVAVRVSAHPVAASVARHAGGLIVSTSANPSGLNPAKTALRCQRYFGPHFPITSGQVGTLDKPTEIHDLLSGDKLR